MVSDLIGHAPLEKRLHDPQILAEVLEEEATKMLVYEHLKFDVAEPVLRSFVEKDLKIVLLIRNPLDAFVSAAFYKHWKNGAKTNIDFEQVIKSDANIFKRNLNNQAASWMRFPGIHVVKYEKLVTETKSTLNLIADHYKVNPSKKEIHIAVETFKFEALSGGRKRGDSMNTHHYRKGIIGDYHNYLTKKQQNFLLNLWVQELKELQYT